MHTHRTWRRRRLAGRYLRRLMRRASSLNDFAPWLVLTWALLSAAGCSCASAYEPDAGVDAGVDAFCVPDPAGDVPPPTGSCDGLGAARCQSWANVQAGSQWDGVSYCFSMGFPDAGYPSCVRGDGCTFVGSRDGGSSPYECQCGGESACAPGFVCARPHGVPGASLRCVCAAGGGSP